MAVTVNGQLPPGVTAKDLILAIIAQIGTGGGQGYIIEYRGEAIRSLSMEGRLTVCNMSIEAGARAGLVAPDETTFAYLKDKPHAPQGQDWEAALELLAVAAHRPRRDLRPRGHAGRDPAHPVRDLGDQPRSGAAAGLLGARPGRPGQPRRAGRGRAGPALHGPDPGHPAHRHRGGHGVRGLLHQRPDRGPAGRRRDHPAAGRSHDSLRMLVVPGLDGRAGPGRAGGPGRGVQGGRAPSGGPRAARCAWA